VISRKLTKPTIVHWNAHPRRFPDIALRIFYRGLFLFGMASVAAVACLELALARADAAAPPAHREGKLPFPYGAIITRLAWNYVSSEENSKVFGRAQSFVAGTATNVKFMVKDSKKYATTGGWGFAWFNDGKAVDPSPA
jgi:Cytochrome P460